MTKSRPGFIICLAAAFCLAAAPRASAADDFGRIVHHIETQYHVHRQHRWAMGLAGFVVKFYHFAGVKSLKGAIFENQVFLDAGADTKFDEVIRAALDSGWQPMVQSWDRHSGERTYIYARYVTSKNGTDMKVLIVSLEPNEAVVLQVKMDPRKFTDFVEEATAGHNHHNHPRPAETQGEPRVEALSPAQPSWDGMCLMADAGAPSQP
ncbi:MAG TPA: hypothetical protein VFR84_16335 [Candidatus Angelobacter sp.]|nr:hypothetical protein [Candidatus Angelobacter sp.]